MTSDSDTPDQRFHLDLTPQERRMLAIGLGDWGGPAYGSQPLARAMGFEGLDDLEDEGPRLSDDVLAKRRLSKLDWTRAMVATEIGFVSAPGTGPGEWEAIHGGRAEDWFRVLRRLQFKVRAQPDLLPE